ncbi:helix-turn-helix domain-containing protein [Aerococcus urinae]|uniref:helix-turn-helix domain-containing protein n=1 Tax=Aerococcus urinae TaxID=1376 RepID=UPI0034DE1DFB
MKQGYSLEEIAKNRHLKVSTIADHYVDIMLSRPEVLAQEASDLFGADLKKIDWSLAYDHFESFQKAFPKAPYWLYRYYQVIQVKEAGKEQARC